jgi:hypothetical protein
MLDGQGSDCDKEARGIRGCVVVSFGHSVIKKPPVFAFKSTECLEGVPDSGAEPSSWTSACERCARTPASTRKTLGPRQQLAAGHKVDVFLLNY